MPLRALDHFLVVVADLEDACQRYQQLGFTVVPPQQHKNVGSANCVIHFQNTYFELFGQVDKIRLPQWRDFYMERLSLGEGMGNISFTAAKLTDEQVRLRRQGLTIFEPISAKRDVPLPSGAVLETDSESVYTDNNGRAYLSPFFSEHRKLDAIFVPELQTHANTVTDLIGVVAVSDEVDGDTAYFRTLAEVQTVSQIQGGLRLMLAKGHYVDILASHAVDDLYGPLATYALEKGGMVVGLVCKTKDLSAARSVLSANNVPMHHHNNTLIVPHSAARGIFLSFTS